MAEIPAMAPETDSKELLDQVGREAFSFPSSDGATTVVGDLWTPPPTVEPVLLVQLVHGMAEHIGRYDPFARALAVRGCVVAGHDHLGHGRSVAEGLPKEESWGRFIPNAGAEHLVSDVQSARLLLDARYPDMPHVMFGHSMGSFVLRTFLGKHGEGLEGAIVCGTGWQPRAALAVGRAVTSIIGHVRGWGYRSAFVDSLAAGAYARVFADAEGGDLAWLTRDAAHRDLYRDDPAAGFVFSVGAYHELFRLVGFAQDKHIVCGMPSALPVFLIAGSDDPVGGMGAAIPKVASLMAGCGVRDVEQKPYPGARHEILNETNRSEVLQDIVDWLRRKGLLNDRQ